MLYVSRFSTPNSVGVVDTDDGSEEIVGMLRLSSIVNMKGIDIKGVKMRSRGGFAGNQKVIDRVEPYQCEIYGTPAQTKASLLLHTDIMLWRRMITSIKWRFEEIDKPVTIRLSDFGAECADCMLYGNEFIGRHAITIIVDNFIKVNPYTFYPQSRRQQLTIDGVGVKFDLRECTSGLAAKLVYDAVVMNAEDYIAACESIIDNEKRKSTMLQGWGMMKF